ncbi:MAG TPA: DUF5916 domain-containing protein [Ignavibacteriaceae bacterium]|nr:DUF5916 domain-containing protein [Ignavibacteriaceae bacterium]
MKKLLLLIFCSTLLFASSSRNQNKVMLLKEVNTPIKIDGEIDDEWSKVDSVSDFFQLQPYYGKNPSRRTIAKVLTTADALYCLMVCYDNRNDIQAGTGSIDNFDGDVVSIMLDSFNDEKTAYKFAVSASGVQADCRLLDDARNRDYSWDGIWFADSKVYDWGYVVEMKIPYKSFQYDDKANSWGLDFDRWIPKQAEDLYWCSYEQSEGQRISKFGKLVFEDFRPLVHGVNLEAYPVGISKATMKDDNKYDVEGKVGLDLLYNPSPKLKFQLTANPDFAQIEADPFSFNISRYESYFSERRPFFTEGNEIFMASGKQTSTGFYSPLELFYSRRIGKKLPDGSEVPLYAGTKVFGRINDWEYGGFLAMTGEKNYTDDSLHLTEGQAFFGSARIKKQIFGNSQAGLLFVGKQTKDSTYGVIDLDGAFRASDWQLAYQVARSIKNSTGDYAFSAGFTRLTDNMLTFARGRYIGDKFDISEVGYVPWMGTGEFTSIAGPLWNFETGYIRQIIIYGGPSFYYEKADNFTDYFGLLGFNMQLRDNWGYEINAQLGKAKDEGLEYTSYNVSLSSWYGISPKWSGNLYGGYSKTYNFSREYLAPYSWFGIYINWKAADILDLGTSYDMYVEGNPDGHVEDITYNARPYFSLTPVNNLNIRVYVDNVFIKSVDRLDHVIAGFLFSYNFSPKSWIYLALNEVRDRSDEFDKAGNLQPYRMHTVDRAGVFKIKYLYYF